ncbi:MAG: MBL fold metallo-hydrolase [Rubrivivax sp.]|nr:MBL fold metallo-hydrolase [Rubrivivax sp.]
MSPTPTPDDPALRGLTILERGWLSSNNVLLHGGGAGAVLIDASHALHGEQTVALVRQALAGEPLLRVVNTHLHSDHCGGNAALARAFGCRIAIPPGQWDAARAWDEARLSYRSTGQTCERFVPDDCIAPGDEIVVAGRRWQALAAPGHDPYSLVFFDAGARVLISADALWGNGFGVVFPELDGVAAFDEVGATLDLIERLDPRWVIPGHGPPFQDVADALARARRRLASWRADPARHAAHGLKVFVKYHLMEVRREPWPALREWLATTPLFVQVWQRSGRPEGSPTAHGERLVHELIAQGALREAGGEVLDA